MGEANRRGTKEQRIDKAIQKKQEEKNKINNLIEESIEHVTHANVLVIKTCEQIAREEYLKRMR